MTFRFLSLKPLWAYALLFVQIFVPVMLMLDDFGVKLAFKSNNLGVSDFDFEQSKCEPGPAEGCYNRIWGDLGDNLSILQGVEIRTGKVYFSLLSHWTVYCGSICSQSHLQCPGHREYIRL